MAAIQFRPFFAAFCAVLFATPLAILSGCTHKDSANTASKTSEVVQELVTTGEILFNFDYQAVHELLLAKVDPDSGDRWTARLSRPEGDREASGWKVQGAGGSLAPLESRADGYFVLHLLDTLRTLRVEQTRVGGSLESLGLNPPRYGLQWRERTRSYELRIGAATKEGGKVYAWIPGQPGALVISGATLQMLGYLDSFTSLRLKTWAGVAADDVDEIKTPKFYAQRDGAEWTDKKHRPIKAARGRPDIGEWLEQLTHQRVREFIDEPTRVEKLNAQLDRSASQSLLRSVRLIDRHGNATHLEVGKIEGKWFARSTARPGGVFEVYPESLSGLK